MKLGIGLLMVTLAVVIGIAAYRGTQAKLWAAVFGSGTPTKATTAADFSTPPSGATFVSTGPTPTDQAVAGVVLGPGQAQPVLSGQTGTF